jgi:hypothetical protein
VAVLLGCVFAFAAAFCLITFSSFARMGFDEVLPDAVWAAIFAVLAALSFVAARKGRRRQPD